MSKGEGFKEKCNKIRIKKKKMFFISKSVLYAPQKIDKYPGKGLAFFIGFCYDSYQESVKKTKSAAKKVLRILRGGG